MNHHEFPIIGITGNYDEARCTLNEPYYKAVLAAGGTPVIIPPLRIDSNYLPYSDSDELEPENKMLHTLAGTLDTLDAIIFSGGGDINPLLLGEQPIPQLHAVNPERDIQELLLVKMAAERQMPILGICRGMQIINAAMGGTLLQDIATQATLTAPLVKHSQDMPRDAESHRVDIDPDSLLHHIYGTTQLAVNSFHHQAIDQAAPGLKITARSADGVAEAIESSEHKSIVAVQWHPECLSQRLHERGDDDVFDWIVKEGRSYRSAKQLHRRILTLDSHCDTPMHFKLYNAKYSKEQQFDFVWPQQTSAVDCAKMLHGGLDASIMVAYLEQGERDKTSLVRATSTAWRILQCVKEMADHHPEYLAIARTPDELYDIKRGGRRAIMLGIENGYAIGGSLSNIEMFRNDGVVYMTLCHNGDNDICDSASESKHEHGGVSSFGAKVIEEMNRLGMMVDLSHGSEKSFYDAIDISTTPIVCSHSSARALCDHPRNLTDDQLRALARNGGVVQVTMYPGFLKTAAQVEADGQLASVADVVRHINHCVDIMGVEHVGIGTDFDGGGGVPGCQNAAELINLTRLLLRERYSEKDLSLIWGENFLRVMRQVQAAAV